MANQVSRSEFTARAFELFRQVEVSGEPLIVTENGEPKVEIRRHVAKSRDPLDRLRGSVIRYDRPTDPVDETG